MGLIIFLKIINQIKDLKHTSTDIFNFTPIIIECETKLTF